ncbi:MAG: efflux RND transporter permease subunit [Thermoguttaceae bacterium]
MDRNRRTFFNEYGFIIIFIVVFLLAFIWMGTKRTLMSNSNNVADWLPERFPETQQYKWFIRHFPFESFIVVSWKGCVLGDSRLEMFADRLVPGQSIYNPDSYADDVAQIIAELNVTNTDQIKLPIVKKNSDDDSTKSDPESGAKSSKDSGENQGDTQDQSDTKKVEQEEGLHYFKTVVTGPRLVELMKRENPDLTDEQIYKRLDGVLVGPQFDYKPGMPEDYKHRNSALIVTLSSAAKGKELRKVVAKIREIGYECGVGQAPPPDNRSIAQKGVDELKKTLYEMVYPRTPSTDGVILGGPPIDNVAIDYEGERTLVRLAGICAFIGFVISLICLRSLRLTLFVFIIAVLAAGISMALVSFTGGHCDAILLSMPALIYVLTMSGAIHIINYYHDAIREHGLQGAAERAIQHAWYPCSIANLTTAFGLFSLYMSSLVPIIKFGLYSGIGVLAALLLLFLYLPSLLHFYPSRKYAELYGGRGLDAEKNSIFLRFWMFFGGFVIRNNLLVCASCFILMGIGTYGLTNIKTSVKMMRFFTPDSEIIAHYGWLEEQLGPLVPMEVVIEFNNEKCHLQPVERLQLITEIGKNLTNKPEVGGLMSAATFAQELQMNKAPGRARDIYMYGANQKIENNRYRLKDNVTYEHVSLDKSSYKTEDDKKKFTGIIEQMGITQSEADKLVAAGLSSHEQVIFAPSNKIIPELPPAEFDAIKKKVRDWQNKYGKDLWRVSIRVWALKQDIDYAIFIEDVKAVVEPMIKTIATTNQKVLSEDAITTKYTGMVPVVYKTQHELLKGLKESLLLAFITIAIVMMFVLKSPIAGFLSMLPNVFPIIIVFGYMGLAGILVDVGTMMTASVAIGIAVDNTIHFLTWFRDGIDRGLNAKEAAMDSYERCATAMSQTTLIGGLGLSAFAFSTFTPTQMFGVMMLALLSVSLVGDLIFLPSILTGPAGKFFYKAKKVEEGQNETNIIEVQN